MGSQVSGTEALNVRPDLAVFPQVCMLPSPGTATLATEGKEEHVLVRKNNKRSKSPGWVLTEIQATSHVPSVPSSVASPAVLKHTFWSETSWSLTADHFPQLLLSLSF